MATVWLLRQTMRAGHNDESNSHSTDSQACVAKTQPETPATHSFTRSLSRFLCSYLRAVPFRPLSFMHTFHSLSYSRYYKMKFMTRRHTKCREQYHYLLLVASNGGSGGNGQSIRTSMTRNDKHISRSLSHSLSSIYIHYERIFTRLFRQTQKYMQFTLQTLNLIENLSHNTLWCIFNMHRFFFLFLYHVLCVCLVIVVLI